MKAAPKFKKGDMVVTINEACEDHLQIAKVTGSFYMGDMCMYHLDKMPRGVSATGESNLEISVIYGTPLYEALK